MMLYYHQFGYRNYALACFEHVAHCQLLLSERMKALITQECFVNNRGKSDTNLAMDLDLEHSNHFFKDHFLLKSHIPSQPVLNRLSLAQDKLERTLDSFYTQFNIKRNTPLRLINSDAYLTDVKKLQQHLSPRSVFTKQLGRKLYSPKLMKASHDLLLTIDMFELKEWLKKSLRNTCDQPFIQ